MNSMALRRSDCQAMSRNTGNSPRRQGATDVASTCGGSKPAQRTPYTTRQSLSRSYDSPEGIHRISQVSTKKSGCRMLRRSASPPASSAVRKHIDASSARNQTILDDAAWMTERIQNFQKTGFSRYTSRSKLRDSAHIAASCGQSLSASHLGYEESFCFSESPSQSSNSLQTQTAITYADEPLSAFRLSEVTLSEEDLLTNFSSTCNSTPVSLQSGCTFDRTAADYYQGNSCLDNAKCMCSNTAHKDSATCSHNNSSNIRGDLLHRLEALQHRAELAAKSSHSNETDFNKDNQNWDVQVLLWSQDSLSSTHGQNAISLRSAAASPTHSTFESPSWLPEGPENSSDSTCWLHAEVKNQPYVSHLVSSSSRIIRPEYYLPLSKEEEPAHKAVVSSCLSSPNYERKLVPKDDNCKRSAPRRSSPLCQHRAEDIIPRKGLSCHKKSLPARKSRRSLEKSTDSVNRSAMARGLISATRFSLLEPCPIAAREACLTESVSTQISSCAGYNMYTNPIHDVLSIEEDGQVQKKLDYEVDCDGEASWISEENVEGFLRSRCLTVDHVDALNTSPEFSDANGGSITKETVSLLGIDKHSQTKDKKPCPYEQSLSSLSGNRNGCLHDQLTKCNKVSMERSAMFSNCKQSFRGSEGSPTINSQTSSYCQGFLAHSHSSLPELDDMNLLRKPVGQACLTEEGKLHDSDPLLCCKTIPDFKHANGSQEEARTMGQPYSEEKHVLCCKGSEIVSSEALSATLETQKQLPIAKMPTPFCLERSRVDNSNTEIAKQSLSLDTIVSSEICRIEYKHSPVVAEVYEKASPLQGLSEGSASQLEYRNFTKISRSLSFNDKGTDELEARSNESTCNDLSELKSKSFSHYWIRNSAYSLDVSELLNSVTRGSREPDERNSGKILQGSKGQETNGQMEQELSKEVQGVVGMDKEHGGTCVSLYLPKTSCMTASAIVTGEVLSLTGLKCSQQCHQIQLVDSSAETLNGLRDDSKVVKDGKCWQKPIMSKEVPKYPGNSEIFDRVNLQEALSKGKDVGTKVVSKYKDEPEQEECERCEELTLSEQCVSKTSTSYHNNHVLLGGTTKDSNNLEPQIPCSPSLQDSKTSLSGRVMKTPSILSVYKNPLWLDENSTNFENHHTLQDEEFLDFTYRTERSIGFLDSVKSRLSFSERFENKTWDTYKGMGAFISPPDSPYCNDREKVSEASLLGFANLSDVDSLWDARRKVDKKLKKSSEEVENGNASVCKLQVVENCLASKDLISCKLPGFDAKLKLPTSDHADQQQLLVSHAQPSLKSDLTSQIASSSSSVKVLSIVDGNCNGLSLSSAPLLCSERCLQLKDASTTHTKNSSYGAKMSVSLENCSSEQLLWPDSASLISKNVTIQDVAVLARETRDHKLLYTAPSTDSTDEAEAGEAVDNPDRSIDRLRQEPCAPIKATGAECRYPLDSDLSFVNGIDKNQSSNDPIMLSNDEMEAREEVKRVTFVYSSSKESPNKSVNAALPDVPLDLSSTCVLSLLSRATKGDGNLKKREQKKSLEPDKTLENQADLSGLGGKVEALEAQIDKFKRENEKLQNLVTCMIRKMKQLQQSFRGRKRLGTSKGCMTCLYSLRVQRCRSKTLRKS
ncbi:hypothetical protein GOP47_0020251 [Adiantum capillus-veneris]|uniref:Uncharacterized protein n=1 Tax=Adiantum capillus-veneris TaxID=13818 RepID=A0A9D4UCN7_ADICA|nr:hypothetical protein GOP47_0020251 [Adiantum capillus-veneris]